MSESDTFGFLREERELHSGLGGDCVANPDLQLRLEHTADSAGWFWVANGSNALADQGDVTALTRRINGGLTGLAERQASPLATQRALQTQS